MLDFVNCARRVPCAQGLIWGIMAIGVYITYQHSGYRRPDRGRLLLHRRRRVRHAACWPA